jgi:NAD-dependent SIR2 family protein deacetylase
MENKGCGCLIPRDYDDEYSYKCGHTKVTRVDGSTYTVMCSKCRNKTEKEEGGF